MLNRIQEITIVNRRLDPNETVLHLFVHVKNISPATEIRGRLMGPRCAYLSTVEIAYPLREVERNGSFVLTEVIIPEPSWWEPKSPLLYEGPLELWQDGQLCERNKISHAIRWLQMTSKGLKLNGRPFLLRGKVVEPTCSAMQMQQLHEAGFNTVFTTPDGACAELGSLGDRHGLFVSGEWNDAVQTSGGIVRGLDILENSGLQNRNALQSQKGPNDPLLPHNPAFTICREEDLLSLPDNVVPKIVLTKSLPKTIAIMRDVIGWIESPTV
jgi:hypothetical protein